MIITAKTKVSDLIKANPASIDAIAEINKHFRKLKNPILRRTLAKRVTIADAAIIGGVSVEVFFEKLTKIGFELAELSDGIGENKEIIYPGKENNTMELTAKQKIVDLDVRPNITSGNDPFQVIMAAIKELPDNAVLKIINTFEPIPLINILKGKGYQTKVERPEAGVVHTYFKKGETTTKTETPEVDANAIGDFDTKMQEYSERLKTIDVRQLEMPEPMVTILSELEILPEGYALFVHHKKLPKFLLPELKTRGYQFVKNRIDDHNIDFLFFKD